MRQEYGASWLLVLIPSSAPGLGGKLVPSEGPAGPGAGVPGRKAQTQLSSAMSLTNLSTHLAGLSNPTHCLTLASRHLPKASWSRTGPGSVQAPSWARLL